MKKPTYSIIMNDGFCIFLNRQFTGVVEETIEEAIETIEMMILLEKEFKK